MRKISHIPLLKTFTVLVLWSTLMGQQVLGQLSDDFSDGDFTANPVWSGSNSDFIINASQQLQLNNSVASTSYLSAPFAAATLNDMNWEFYVKQTFSGSGSNFGKVYIVSDQANLTASLNGYYLQFGEGGSNDAVELFRQTGLTTTSVCRATNAAIASSFAIRIKVSRNNAGVWQLFIDYSGGTNLILEATGTDNTYSTSSYFGIRCSYTASNANKFFYDTFSIASSIIVDTTPPEIQSVAVVSSSELSVVFSEDINEGAAEDVLNFSVSDGIGNPVSSNLQPDKRTVSLLFTQAFPNGKQRTLSIKDVNDLNGNSMLATQRTFLFFQSLPVQFKDVIITEIFADPSPTIGLPEAEFIEIYNRSDNPFDLASWKITDGSSTGNLTSLILLPGDYLILSPASSATQYGSFGKTISISNFPTLNNSGDVIMLKDQLGVTVDSVNYFSSWYRDDDKKEGGWSLELINPENFCDESGNWIASNKDSGGSPGMQNSVFVITQDLVGPKLLSVTSQSLNLISLKFDERLKNTQPQLTDFTIEPFLGISSVSFADASLTKINLSLSQEIEVTKVYKITVQNIFDCPGNVIQAKFSNVTLKLDNTSPALQLINVISSTEVELTFSEKVDKTIAENILNYEVLNGIGNPVSATVRSDQQVVALLFSKPFINGVEETLRIQNITDLVGNEILTVEKNFMFFQSTPANFKDIIITEIFPDPSPQVGLPEAEFIELYNRSDNPFDLNSWKFTDGSSTSNLSSLILLPQEYLIICSSTSGSKFVSFGKTLGASSFPSLNNSGEGLVLKDSSGAIVDSVYYAPTWFKDEEKKDGGWSLELIDLANICADSENWIAAEDAAGGTPGNQNSVFAEKPDLTGPKLVSVFALTPTTIELQFNEKLEKKLPSSQNFILSPLLEVSEVAFSDPSFKFLTLSLSQSLTGGTTYNIITKEIYDCPGNIISTDLSHLEFALPEEADSLDIVVNEILFNPRPTGVDFLEVYNRSAKFVNLKGWRIVNIDNGIISSEKIITDKNFLMNPESYIVFTEDGNVLKGEYLQGQEETFFQVDLPSLPDDEGSVALLNAQGEVIDFLLYKDRLHSVFIKDDEGVSLERIDFNPSRTESNWKSSSSVSGFATPGYLNSNSRTEEAISDEAILIEPEIFSPMHGQPDFAQIKYNFDKGGYVANVKIFDPAGREIKQLANNELIGTEGFFRWDGDHSNGSKARVGAYMVWFEVFDEEGVVKTFRKRVVVAEKF